MKQTFFALAGVLLLVSCKYDEDSVQKIDQTMDIYIKDSSGNDLLNPNRIGSYTAVSMNDALGEKDITPVSYTREIAADSVYYLRYVAGAKRVLTADNGDSQTYSSVIALAITQKVTETTTALVNDTIEIEYRFSPTVFEVSKVFYNNQLRFTKIPDQPNVVTVVK